jgi:outer membrane lipoprotein-sorting protein
MSVFNHQKEENMIQRFTAMLALTLLTITCAAAPTVDEILDKYVKALGGKEAIEKATSRVAKGSMELEGMGVSGPIETYTKAPSKNASFVDFQGMGKFVRVFDGAKGYELNPMEGLREVTGVELAQFKRNSDFHEPLNLKKHYSKLEVQGKAKVGETDAYIVVATPAEGDPEKLYFAADTGLLVRTDANAETAQGKMAVEVYLSDYKDVDGVKVPHGMRQVSPAFTLVIKLSEVKNNVTIEDTKFAKPQ